MRIIIRCEEKAVPYVCRYLCTMHIIIMSYFSIYKTCMCVYMYPADLHSVTNVFTLYIHAVLISTV